MRRLTLEVSGGQPTRGISTERRLEKPALPAAQEVPLAPEYLWKRPAPDVAGVRHPPILGSYSFPLSNMTTKLGNPAENSIYSTLATESTCPQQMVSNSKQKQMR